MIPEREVILVILGGVLLLAGLAGHGIKTSWFELGAFSTPLRWVAFAIGAGLIALGVYLPSLAPPPPSPAPPQPSPVEEPAEPPPEPPTVAVEGTVLDVFGNPRKNVVVMATEQRRYGMTGTSGEYLIEGIELPQSVTSLTLEARHGQETDETFVRLEKDDSGTVKTDEALVLDPITGTSLRLCEKEKLGASEDDPGKRVCRAQLGTPVLIEGDHLDVCALARVKGPQRYRPKPALTAEWFRNEESVDSKTWPYSLSPDPRDGLAACKTVWPGRWRIEIKTDQKLLEEREFVVTRRNGAP